MNDNDAGDAGRLSTAGKVAIAILFGLLGVAIWYAIASWNQMSGVGMSTAGWVFMIAGIVVTTALGGGLMGLVFYSARKGHDR